jgi:eukaryotic-like serine/threonine-protein kinase
MVDGEATVIQPDYIDRYKLIRVIGSGAMGVVYLAHDEGIDRYVAIKTIHNHLLHGEDGADWMARFRREVRAAGRCLHPNIVTIFEYGTHNSLPYIVMEYVQGRTLRDHLKEQRPMLLGNALTIIIQVLQGLSFAHVNGVVHRDIKPGNIMLLSDGHVKVTDFGIARIEAVHNMTQVGMALGTPSYMSPEQYDGDEVDLRSDLFSVGVVLFEILTGVRPFSRGETGVFLNDLPRRATQLNPHLPVELDAVFDTALARMPNKRFQNARLFIAALENLQSLNTRFDNPGFASARMPPNPAAQTQAGTTLHWNPALLEQAAKRLVVYLGPVAKVLVHKAALQANSPAELIQQLMLAIPKEADRLMFQRQMQIEKHDILSNVASPVNSRSLSASSNSNSQMSGSLGSFNQSLLETVRQDLAVYLGPIAKVLVKQAAVNAQTEWDLYEQLAKHIPTALEREAFLKKGEKLKRNRVFL